MILVGHNMIPYVKLQTLYDTEAYITVLCIALGLQFAGST